MKKAFFKSKTLWGFGLAGLIALAQVLGISYSEVAVTQIVQIISLFYGGYGLRDAVDK